MISVTECLNYFTEPELLAWMLREGKVKCEKISTVAKQIGSTVDALIQADVKGIVLEPSPVPYSTEVMNCLQAWQRFKEDHPLFVSTITGVQTELTDGEIVGHPDLEITEKERWGIVDIKTSKAIQPKHLTQVAAYFHLSKRNLFTPQAFVGIIRLDKLTGHYEYTEIVGEDIQYEIEVFQAYLTAYQHGQRIREVLRQQLETEVLDAS